MEGSRTLKEDATSAFLWDYSGNLAGAGATFVIGVILARLLAPEEFGLVAMVAVFIALVQGLMDFGLSGALVQRSNPTEEHFMSAFVVNVLLGLTLAGAAYAAAPLIARFYDESRLVLITRVLGLGFVLRSLCLVHEAWLRKHLKFKALTQIRIGASLVGGGVGIALAWTGWGVWSLVAQSLVSASIRTCGLWVLSGWRPRRTFSFNALGELWAYGSHMFTAGILNTVFTKVDVLIVGRLFSAAELGFFTRAKRLIQFVVRFSSDSVARVMFPVLSSIQDEDERFRRISIQTLSMVSFAAFFLSGWLYVVAQPLIVLLLTDTWSPTAPLLQLFCLSGYVLPVNSIVLSMLKSKGHSKVFLLLEVIKKSLYLPALVFGFRFGIHGYLIALAVVSLINTGVNMVVTARVTGLTVREMPMTVAPYVLSAVIAGTVSMVIPVEGFGETLMLIGSTLVFATVYLLMNWILRTDGPPLALATLRSLLQRKFR